MGEPGAGLPIISVSQSQAAAQPGPAQSWKQSFPSDFIIRREDGCSQVSSMRREQEGWTMKPLLSSSSPSADPGLTHTHHRHTPFLHSFSPWFTYSPVICLYFHHLGSRRSWHRLCKACARTLSAATGEVPPPRRGDLVATAVARGNSVPVTRREPGTASPWQAFYLSQALSKPFLAECLVGCREGSRRKVYNKSSAAIKSRQGIKFS